MNIFLYELKTYRKSALIWATVFSLGIIVFFSMYPAFTKDVVATKKVLENFPPALRSALGISLQNFFTIFGFYAYLFTFLSLVGAIQAMNIGVGIFSKESNLKTIDFLLSKPVTRARIMTSKLLAALATLLITNVIFNVVALITAEIVSTDKFSAKIFILISLTLLLIQLMFLALGTFFSVIIPKIKSVIGVSLPTVFAFFIIGTLGEIIGNETVRYFTPFKFFDPIYIINNGHYETKFLLIEIAFIVVAITSSFVIYIRKDIPSAA
jgi:ABC-2 type transport system permease protein